MSFKQKTWTDRISEYPNRRTLTDVSDNTTKIVIVAREEGTISQIGDAYSAANMNDLEQRVADGFSTLSQDSVKIATKNTTSDSIAFGIDSKGNYGYIKKGADTVIPFKSQTDIDNAYNSGVSAADARVNTSSASYNQGVSDADKRVNTSSASYKSGYTKGQSDTYNTSLIDVYTGTAGGGNQPHVNVPAGCHFAAAVANNNSGGMSDVKIISGSAKILAQAKGYYNTHGYTAFISNPSGAAFTVAGSSGGGQDVTVIACK